MTIRTLIFLMSFISILNPNFSQIWPKEYLANKGTCPWSCIQCYDKGYLIGGWLLTSDGFPINGLILKTDINGELLWYKTLVDIVDGTGIQDINQTDDNGWIIAGGTPQTDPWSDPFILKVNACGELEWCRIYSVGQNRADVAEAVEQIPGGYIAYVWFGENIFESSEICHLYRLDNDGDLVWQQSYGQSDTLMHGAFGEDMIVSSANEYIITGWCYYPDSVNSNLKYLKPLIIKVDSSGTVEWEEPWSEINGDSFHGETYRSILDNQNIIYSCGRHIESSATPPGDRPTLFKTDSNGNELAYFDLVPDSWQAVFYNLNWFQDSTIEIDGGWGMYPSDEGQIAVFKVDRNGNILDSANIIEMAYCFSDAIVDQDNKVFLVQGQHKSNQWRSYSWKLNSNLEFDTLYTQPFVYDSLCPHPIASDTIPLDCVVVGVDEPFQNPETGRLKAYPNPTESTLHIEIPDKIKTVVSIPSYDVTTVYHEWHSATLEIYDLFGRKIHSQTVTQGQTNIDIDLTTWMNGMYVVRLVYNGHTVASVKVVKN
jgi:hypothetical protein